MVNKTFDLEKDEEEIVFPRWYGIIKWGLPLTVALIAGSWVVMMLTNTASVPQIFMDLGFESALKSEGIAAATLASLWVGTVSMMTGSISSIILRGTMLFNHLEHQAYKSVLKTKIVLQKNEELKAQHAQLEELVHTLDHNRPKLSLNQNLENRANVLHLKKLSEKSNANLLQNPIENKDGVDENSQKIDREYLKV